MYELGFNQESVYIWYEDEGGCDIMESYKRVDSGCDPDKIYAAYTLFELGALVLENRDILVGVDVSDLGVDDDGVEIMFDPNFWAKVLIRGKEKKTGK